MIDVVAAVIESEGRYLIARRAAHKTQAGKWEFPGGKVEANESPNSSCASFWRSWSEALGRRHLLSNKHQYPGSRSI